MASSVGRVTVTPNCNTTISEMIRAGAGAISEPMAARIYTLGQEHVRLLLGQSFLLRDVVGVRKDNSNRWSARPCGIDFTALRKDNAIPDGQCSTCV